MTVSLHPSSSLWLYHVSIVIMSLITLLICRIFFVWVQMKHNRRTRQSQFVAKRRNKDTNTKSIRTLVVLGSGGHTTEMLHLLSSVSLVNYSKTKNPTNHGKNDSNIYTPLHYIIAETDTTSRNKLNSFQKQQPPEKKLPHHSSIHSIPRARHVGQSYISSIFTTLYSIVSTARIVLCQTRPDLLLINGPGTCLPIVVWTIVGRIFGIAGGRIIFIESFCRVKSLSLTGRILYGLGLVDLFCVHWEELALHLNGESKNNDDLKQKEEYGECVLLESFMRKS